MLDFVKRIFNREAVPADQQQSWSGNAIYGGYVQYREKDGRLSTHENRYRLFDDMLSNIGIISAGIKHGQTLAGQPAWSIEKAEADDGEYAARVSQALFEDPATPWPQVVQDLYLSNYYGFAVLEWTARRANDGIITFDRFSRVAPYSLERWDVTDTGEVVGMVQRDPQYSRYIYLPRDKVVYISDRSLGGGPDGMPMARLLVEHAELHRHYVELQAAAFDGNLNSPLVGKAPLSELREAALIDADPVASIEAQVQGALTAAVDPLRKIVAAKSRQPDTGIVMDSATYKNQVANSDAESTSSIRKWDIERIKSDATAFDEIGRAIEATEWRMAAIMGVEGLMTGKGGSGSLALSKDKSNTFFIKTNAALKSMARAVNNDLVQRLFQLNGWDEVYRPTVRVENLRFYDASAHAATLRDLAQAGIMEADLEEQTKILSHINRDFGLDAESEKSEKPIPSWETMPLILPEPGGIDR